MKFQVIGAGLAGLLASAMIRDECFEVVESQPSLPNNHEALLRFRSSVVGDTLNVPFRKVQVMKTVKSSAGNPVGDALAYSLKTTGVATLRSINGANGALESRYIAPTDLVQVMARKVTAPINFGKQWSPMLRLDDPAISTIPMPVLMKILSYDGPMPEFRHSVGYSMKAELKNVDAYATVYFPSPHQPAYRASITGNVLIVEYAFPSMTEEKAAEAMNRISEQPFQTKLHLGEIMEAFGLTPAEVMRPPKFQQQKYAKILPVNDDARKRFILWATEKFNIYSLGRFATWRPGLLLDDVVQDVRVIQRIAGGTTYEGRK